MLKMSKVVNDKGEVIVSLLTDANSKMISDILLATMNSIGSSEDLQRMAGRGELKPYILVRCPLTKENVEALIHDFTEMSKEL